MSSLHTPTCCISLLCALVLAPVQLALAQPPGAAHAGESAEPTFDILEYDVAGNTRLPVPVVEKAVYPYLGEHRTVADARKAVAALQKAYQDAGFLTVLVELPEQRLEHNVVRLQVTEGRVDHLRVIGSRYYALGEIKAGVPDLAPGAVPQFDEVQKQLTDLNRAPDRRVSPVMRPGATPGTVDVDLKVDDHLPLHGDLQLNNHNSANTDPLRLSGSLRYDNLWQLQHGFALQFQTSPQDTGQVRLLTGTYTLPITGSDRTIALYAVRSKSNVAAAGNLSVLGDGSIVGVREAVPLVIEGGDVQSLSLGLDLKHFQDNLKLAGADTGRTPIQYAVAPVQYAASLRADDGSATVLGASANVGLRGVYGGSDIQFDTKRFGATAGFFVMRLDVARTQQIDGRWSLFGKMDLQAASGPLISNEQYAAGGADSVRGYRESEALGDDAVHWTAELRQALPVAWRPPGTQEFYWELFSDGANVRIKDPLPGQRAKTYLSSAGIGLRLNGWHGVHAALDYAYPLLSASNTARGEARTSFNLGYEF